LGIAACLLLITMIPLIIHFPGSRRETSDAQSAVSVEVSYRVPAYTFRKEGNLILDTVSEETVVISETLLTTKHAREKQEKKMPL